MYRIPLQMNLQFRLYTIAIILLLLASCAHEKKSLTDITEVRRLSYQALVSNDIIKKRNAANIESLIGIKRIIRKPVSGEDVLLVTDIKETIIIENLVKKNEVGQYLQRGASNGPNESIHAIGPGENIGFDIPFRGNESGLIMISTISVNLELSVVDTKNQLNCKDKITNGVAFCRLLPIEDANFNIQISNLNNDRAVFTLLSN